MKHNEVSINDSTEKLKEYVKKFNDPEGMDLVPSWVYIELERRKSMSQEQTEAHYEQCNCDLCEKSKQEGMVFFWIFTAIYGSFFLFGILKLIWTHWF